MKCEKFKNLELEMTKIRINYVLGILEIILTKAGDFWSRNNWIMLTCTTEILI